MGRTTRRRRVEPTDEWEQLALLCRWPAQRAHEEIPPLMLFGSSVAERASETGTPERTLYRRVGRFEEEGVEGLFGSEHARRKTLPPAMRRLIVDRARPSAGPSTPLSTPTRSPTLQRALRQAPRPQDGAQGSRGRAHLLRFVRRFAPYREIPEGPERRLAVVALHAEG